MMDPSFDGYDWKKMVTRTAAQQNHFISAAGATDKINYRVGMGYQGERGCRLPYTQLQQMLTCLDQLIAGEKIEARY